SSSVGAPPVAATRFASPISAASSDRTHGRTTPAPTTSISTASTLATTQTWGATRSCDCVNSSTACNGKTRHPMPGTRKLDLVLINPGSRTHVYQSLGANLAAIENPVWAGLMATFCRNRGLSVQIIDAEAEQLLPAEVAERIEDLNPVLAAV